MKNENNNFKIYSCNLPPPFADITRPKYCSPLFCEGDINKRFFEKLKNSKNSNNDEVLRYLFNKITDEGKFEVLFSEWREADFIDLMNTRILSDVSFSKNIKNINAIIFKRNQMKGLYSKKNKKTENIQKLNRLLLEELYPKYFVKYQLIALIMAGGEEMRFGPVKQFIGSKLFLQSVTEKGETASPDFLVQDEYSVSNISGSEEFIVETLLRCEGIINKKNIYIVTSKAQKVLIENALKLRKNLLEKHRCFIDDEQILIEPEKKGTAACILYSIFHIRGRYDEDFTMCVFPSDHDIKDRDAFRVTLRKAISTAEESEKLVTIGIKPTFPATQYGYIECEQCIDNISENSINPILRFHEKPKANDASGYFLDKKHLWNSGIFIWKFGIIIEQFKEHYKDVYQSFEDVVNKDHVNDSGYNQFIEAYKSIKGDSKENQVDIIILQKKENFTNIFVVYGTFDWQDIGKWDALIALFSTTDNICNVNIVGVDLDNRTIYSTGKFVNGDYIKNDVEFLNDTYKWLYCDTKKTREVLTFLQNMKMGTFKNFYSVVVEKTIEKLKIEYEQRIKESKNVSGIYKSGNIESEVQAATQPLNQNKEKIIDSESIEKNNSEKTRIFISHAKKDEVLARHFVEDILIGSFGFISKNICCTSLEGMRVIPDARWDSAIKQKIEECQLTILLITTNFMKSSICLNEMGAAWILNKKIIVIKQSSVKYNKIGVLSTMKQTEKLSDKEGMDRIKDNIYAIFKGQIEECASDRWSRKNDEFNQYVRRYRERVKK